MYSTVDVDKNYCKSFGLNFRIGSADFLQTSEFAETGS